MSTTNYFRKNQMGLAKEAQLSKIDEAAIDGLSGFPNSLGYKVHEIEKHFHNSEHVYGNNTYMTEDYPVAFSVAGGNNAWGTEYMIYAGDTIESGSTTKKLDLNTLYISTVGTANVINVVEFLYGTAGTAITPVVTDDSDNDFELAGHGLAVGDKVIFNSVTTTTGLSANIVYYVLAGSDANHFQVSLTLGGAAVGLTNDGSCSISKLTQTSLTKCFVSKSATAVSIDPYKLVCPRIACSNKLFVRAKSAAGSTIAIGYLLGLHIYSA
jgi:hypothetical protein